MSNRAVPGYVLEEMARRSVTNLLIVKPLNAYPGTFELSSGGRPVPGFQYQKISKNLKDSQVSITTTTTESYMHDHQKRTRVHWFFTLRRSNFGGHVPWYNFFRLRRTKSCTRVAP